MSAPQSNALTERMNGNVLPFPLSRRVGLIKKQAWLIVGQRTEVGERQLNRQVELQRATLLSKGIDHSRVEEQCKALEGAIRAEIWRLVLLNGGAA